MAWIIYIYGLASLVIAFTAFRAGWEASLSAFGTSFLSFWAGVGLRASFYGSNRQKLAGLGLAVVFMGIASWVGQRFSAHVFGLYFEGTEWGWLGFVICFLCTSKRFGVANQMLRAEASRFSIWWWYFKLELSTILTAPLFFFLLYCIAVFAFGAVIQGLALVRASYAVFGLVGMLIAISVLWMPIIAPPLFYCGLLAFLPVIWLPLPSTESRRSKIVFSLAVLILFPLLAYLASHWVALGIGWIADRNPCAALAAGVTGSKPPTNCP